MLLGNFFFVMGQNKSVIEKLPKLKGDMNCTYKFKYSSPQRLQFYPFNVSDSIRLVSFRYHRHDYPIIKDSLVLDSMLENVILSSKDIDILTDILYKNFYKSKPNYGSLNQCFYPRNGIIFYDKAGRIKESILICFHCNSLEKGSSKINTGDECSEKIEKLRLFFIFKGVHFGTNLKVLLYPGEQDDVGEIQKSKQ